MPARRRPGGNVVNLKKSLTRARVRRFEVQLEGPNVGPGEVDFDSLVAFGEHFQDALRRLANVVEGKQAVQPGHPTAAATSAANFRLVGIKKGSAILQLKAMSDDIWPGAADMAVVELARRVHSSKTPLDAGIVNALDEARSSLGTTGAFRVRSHGMKTMVVTPRVVERLRARAVAQTPSAQMHRVVTGWLHMADVQPNEFVIRTPTGVEWRCAFPPTMKQAVLSLLDRVVVAAGQGARTGRLGRLEIESIREAPAVYQETLQGDSERLLPPDTPTVARIKQLRNAGPQITPEDVDELVKAIEERD